MPRTSVVVLPLPVGPVTRMSPSRACKSWPSCAQLVGVKSHAVESVHRRAAVEHANDDFLAMRRRQRRHPEIDGDAVDRDARSPILRAKAVGNVQPGENLDA